MNQLTELTAGDLLTKQSMKIPNKEVVICEDRRLTYEQLNKRVNSLANALIDRGITKGDKVAILLLNSIEYIESYFAIAKCGGISVLINTRLSAKDMRQNIDFSDAKMLIYGDAFSGQVNEIRNTLPAVKQFVFVGTKHGEDDLYEELIKSFPSDEPNVDVRESDECAFLFTGGTTGGSKGVIRTHHAVVLNALTSGHSYGINEDTRILIVAPMFHIAGLEGFSFTTITAGGTICVMKAFDPVKVAENIRNEKLNWAFFVAAMYRVLLDVPRIQEYLSSIRVWGSAAAPMPSDLHHKIVTMFPNVNLFEAYGQTENPKIAMGYHNGVEKSASCGKIAFHSAAIIVDANGKEMPIGEAGEVVVQAPYIMKGYYKNNEETEKVWEGGWLHTGDIGKLDSDGYLYLLDRKKDMIISGAENVYAVEVENVLATNPKIKEVAVIGLPDVKWGEKVTAVVVLKPNESATEDEIIEYAKANMTRYKCPKSVKFTDSLPKSALMKVLKQELRKKYGNT